MRQTVGDEGAEVFAELLAVSVPIAQRDEGDRDLSSRFVRAAHDAAFSHCGMFQQHGLDLSGGDGKSLVLNHLLAPVHNAVETLAVSSHDIARPVPAVSQNSRSGLR